MRIGRKPSIPMQLGSRIRTGPEKNITIRFYRSKLFYLLEKIVYVKGENCVGSLPQTEPWQAVGFSIF
jgi:hypothetical protein